MIYYIENDGKTVATHESISDLERDYKAERLFATHPDENPLIDKSDTGRYVYTSSVDGKSIAF